MFFMSNLTNHNGDIINDRLAERIENLFRDTYRMSEDLQATIQNSVDVCLKDGEATPLFYRLFD
jgi:hypothetical protein